MNIVRQLFFILFLFHFSISGWTDVIELSVQSMDYIPGLNKIVISENGFFYWGSQDFPHFIKRDFRTDQIKTYHFVAGLPLGPVDDFLYFELVPMGSNSRRGFFRMNIYTDELTEDDWYSDIMESIQGSGRPFWISHYQNGITYVQTQVDDPLTNEPNHVEIYDNKTKTSYMFPVGAGFCDMSPDKMHLLTQVDDYIVWNESKTEILEIDGRSVFGLYSIENEENVYLAPSAGRNRDVNLGGGGFINNEIVYLALKNRMYIGNINAPALEQMYPLAVRVEGSDKNMNLMILSPDMTRGYVEKPGEGRYYVDTTPFRDWLNKNGFLFKPTPATANETQIRVRENPNLEAQTFGLLDLGDELEVIDRSGIKVQIGEWEEWWYKIKRKSDGLEGWAYGAFIDVAEEQGLLGADVLGLE